MSNPLGILYFNTKNVKNMQMMFTQCGNNLKSFDLGEHFYTSNVTNMSDMFLSFGLNELKEFSLGEHFDTKNVTNMSGMFNNLGKMKLEKLSLGDKFDTSNVGNMERMFDSTGIHSLTELDLGDRFNTSKVTKMKKMFSSCGLSKGAVFNFGEAFCQYPADEAGCLDIFYYAGNPSTKVYVANETMKKLTEQKIADSSEPYIKPSNVFAKKAIAVPAQFKDTEVEYTSVASNVVGDTKVDGGTIYYAAVPINSSNYKTAGSTVMPAFTEIGSHTVYYFIAANSYEYANKADKFVYTIKAKSQPDSTKKENAITGLKSDSFTFGKYKYKVVDKTSVCVMGYKGTVTKAALPESVVYAGNTYKVTAIAPRAFYKNKKLKKITIGNNIEKIGNEAFYGCKKLSKVSIGTGLREIGKKVFAKDTKLRTMKIKSTKLKKVGNKSLEKCTKLTIKVPKKKVKAYKKLFSKKGQGKKVKVTK